MRKSKVKAKLKRNEPVLLTTLHFFDPSLHEMTSLMGFDGIWLDLEHHGTGMETAMTLMRAARVGTADCMVRPAKGEFMRMGRMLEAGAQGILYPRCDDAAEAKEVVKWAKFAPLGKRGFDSGNPDNPYCFMPMAPYIKAANEETFIAIQIEEQHAVDNAAAIAAVEGVDVLFIGSADLSVTSGIPGQFDHPLIQEAIRKVGEAAKKAGKHWGMPVGTPERAKQLMDMGARFICCGADIIFVKTGLEEMQKKFAPLGFTFENRLA